MKWKLEVPLIKREEEKKWESYMRKYHPLSLPEGKKRLPGELLKYVAELDGKWVALLAWS